MTTRTAPTIAVSSGRFALDTPLGRVDAVYTQSAYADALAACGARPVVLPMTLDPVPGLPGGCQGLLLTGGGDVHPSRYGEAAAPEVYGTDQARDSYELALLEEATGQGLPVLAICRGLQLLNVFLGGTLHQHLEQADVHWQSTEPQERHHPVDLDADSRLAGILGTEPFWVNSFHHQAIDRLAPTLSVSARHGQVVEAAETAGSFVMGVQWHPEHLFATCGRTRRLFQAFTDAAAEHANQQNASVEGVPA